MSRTTIKIKGSSDIWVEAFTEYEDGSIDCSDKNCNGNIMDVFILVEDMGKYTYDIKTFLYKCRKCGRLDEWNRGKTILEKDYEIETKDWK